MPLINFIDHGLAVSYYTFALVAVVGLLQLVAAHHNFIGLSLIPGLRRRTAGYLLGSVLLVGAFPLFFVVKEPAIFRPGPAALELLILFGGAALTGLALTLIGASLLQRGRNAMEPRPVAPPANVRSEGLDSGHASATLYFPTTPGPWPALCGIPGPDAPPDALASLAYALADGGYAVLLLHPDGQTAWQYPEVLALAPTACTLLARRDDIASDRIGLLGFGLGADLALRSGSTDEQVRAVVALAPLLDRAHAPAGLGALQDMTLPQAVTWGRFRAHADLLRHLAPLEHMAQMRGETGIFLLYGADDGLIDVEGAVAAARQAIPSVQCEVLAGEGHGSLLHSQAAAGAILRWLKGRL